MLRGREPAAGWEACRGFDELASRLTAANPAGQLADNHNHPLPNVNAPSQRIHGVCVWGTRGLSCFTHQG